MQRRDIIREIVKRDNQQLPLEEEVVKKDLKSLYDAACEHFGTWDIALHYAGVRMKYRRRKGQDYSPEQVRIVLRRLCRDYYNLSPKHTKQRDGRLYRAAIKHYGSWIGALEAAGINWHNVRMHTKPQRHDRQKLIEDIRRRHSLGLSLVMSEVCYENRTLAISAKNVFGSWGRALVAAGICKNIKGAHKNKLWDADKIIAILQERHRQNKSLKRNDVVKEDPSFVHAVRRHFRFWQRALEAAGVVPKDSQVAEKK